MDLLLLMEIVKELYYVINLMKSMSITDVNVFKDFNIIVLEIVFKSLLHVELTSNLLIEYVFVWMDSPEIHLEHASQFNVQSMKISQMETVSVYQDIKETLKVSVLESVDQMNFYQMTNVSVYQDLWETHLVSVFQSHVVLIKSSSTIFANADQDMSEHQPTLV